MEGSSDRDRVAQTKQRKRGKKDDYLFPVPLFKVNFVLNPSSLHPCPLPLNPSSIPPLNQPHRRRADRREAVGRSTGAVEQPRRRGRVDRRVRRGPCNSTHSSWARQAWTRRREGIGGVVLRPDRGVLLSLFWRWVTFSSIVKRKSTEDLSGVPYNMTLLNCLLSAWCVAHVTI
ncbi:hypothetical protein ACQ4PT_025196 [Festuca glaucescens]